MLLARDEALSNQSSKELKNVEEDGGRSFWNRDYLKRFHKMASRLERFKKVNLQILIRVPQDENAKVLDMCCGSGRNTQLVFDKMNLENGNGRMWAVDFSPQALMLANQLLGNPERILFKDEDVRQMCFADNVFNYVFDIWGSTHIPNQEWKTAIKEAFRVLKPGGYVYFLYWLQGSNFGKCFRSQINVVYPKSQELLEAIKNSGGNVLDAEKAFSNMCLLVWSKKPD